MRQEERSGYDWMRAKARWKLNVRNYYLDGVFGLAIGDAVGCPVEFLERSKMKEHPVTDMIGYGTFNLPEGSWTDDTSLTLASLDSLQACKKINLDDMMHRFSTWLIHGKYTPYGYAFDVGNGVLTSITTFLHHNGYNSQACGGTEEYDNGNGSLMRILPICIWLSLSTLYSLDEKINWVHSCSALTHAHIRSKVACGIYYFLIDSIIHERTDNLLQTLQNGINKAIYYYSASPEYELEKFRRFFQLESFQQLPEQQINSSGYVVDTLEAAIWCAITTNTYREAILKCVNLGDDTDTVAAVCGGMCGLFYGYEAIPAPWVHSLKRKIYIKTLCEEMGERYDSGSE